MYEYLRSAILDSDDSIAAFAQHNGMSREFLRDIIAGRKNPSKDTIDTLIRATGKPYEYLFAEDENMVKWAERQQAKLPETLKLDWKIATLSLRGEVKPDKATLERWKRQIEWQKREVEA